MKRWIFLLVTGLILCASQMAMAAPVLDFTGVWFEQDLYDQQYFSHTPSFRMYSAINIRDNGQSTAFDPSQDMVTITSATNGTQSMYYNANWYYGNTEPYLYGKTLSYNLNFTLWENTTYTFDVYAAGGSTPVTSAQLAIGDDVYNSLSIPLATYDPATRSISWDAVSGIDEYMIRFFDANDPSYCYYSSAGLPTTQTSYSVPWDQFELGDYRIRVEAKDWDVDHETLHNRSTYTTMASNPVPIPGAVWMLFSGLIGILGVKRKLEKIQ